MVENWAWSSSSSLIVSPASQTKSSTVRLVRRRLPIRPHTPCFLYKLMMCESTWIQKNLGTATFFARSITACTTNRAKESAEDATLHGLRTQDTPPSGLRRHCSFFRNHENKANTSKTTPVMVKTVDQNEVRKHKISNKPGKLRKANHFRKYNFATRFNRP